MKSVNRKLNGLEAKTLQPFKFGSSKWLAQDDAEQALFDKAIHIWKTTDFKSMDDFTSEQLRIIDEAERRVWLHGVDFFNELVGGFIHFNNPMGKMLWNMWLLFFINEATIGIRQLMTEEQISMQEGKTQKQINKELEPLYAKWVHPFTTERFSKHISDTIDRHSFKNVSNSDQKKCQKKKVKP